MAAAELETREVMTRRFLGVAPEDTLAETAERMVGEGFGSALVLEDGRLVGILTSRDVLRAIAARAHPSVVRVRQWMTAEPQSVSADATAGEAARAMIAGGFHHLPVVAEDGRPIGVVGLRAVALPTHWPGW